jgi:hypothetical protein
MSSAIPPGIARRLTHRSRKDLDVDIHPMMPRSGRSDSGKDGLKITPRLSIIR